MTEFFNSLGLALDKLTRVSLTWEDIDLLEEPELTLALPMRDLLIGAHDLEYVASCGNILAVILRVIWWSRHGSSHGLLDPPYYSTRPMLAGACLVNLNDEDAVNIQGGETLEFIEDLANRWDCLAPEMEEYEFLHQMLGTAGGTLIFKMESDQTNPELSFDILGLVFSHYVDGETVEHPLETLLLVCRDWNDAALGHRALWTNIRIRMGHGFASGAWLRRLPRRLERSGPSSCLDIDIRTPPEDPNPFSDEDLPEEEWEIWEQDERRIWKQTPCHLRQPNDDCDCHNAANKCAHQALKLLEGEEGQHCVRWRSLELHLSGSDNENIALALRYPTPNLTRLKLVNFRLSPWCNALGVLPSIPLVRQITLLDCFIPSFPSFENATEAIVGWTSRGPRFEKDLTLSNLHMATRVQKLSLQTTAHCEVPLPAQMNELRVLHIEGKTIPTALYVCEIPGLSCLTMNLRGYEYNGYWMDELFNSPRLALGSLRRLTLIWDSIFPQEEPGEQFILPIRDLLTQAQNLNYVAASGNILSIIIRVLWWSRQARSHGALHPPAEPTRHLLRGVCLVNLDGGKTVVTGWESANFFVDLARRWYCVAPDLDEESFFDPMTVSA